MLRQLLRAVPCECTDAARFRAAIAQMARSSATSQTPESREATGREVLFHLRAQRMLRDLNARYFPGSELTERERIERVARYVGLGVPNETGAGDQDPTAAARR